MTTTTMIMIMTMMTLCDDDNIVDVWTMLTLLRCPIVLRSTAAPIPKPSSISILISVAVPPVPVHSIDALRQIMSLNCTRPGLLFCCWFPVLGWCHDRNEKLHTAPPTAAVGVPKL